MQARPLCAEVSGRLLLDSVIEYQRQHLWWVRVFLLMPDHLHALMAFPRAAGMSGTIRQWKAFHARWNGIAWQSGYFDHRIRSSKSLSEKASYIRQNPVVKGLCATAHDWPWVVDAEGIAAGQVE